jgi:hypothetical protein
LGHEVEKFVLGEFWVFTLIYEENLFGGIRNWWFFDVLLGGPRRVGRRGDNLCSLCALLGEFIGNSPVRHGVNYYLRVGGGGGVLS